ncbi:MAG: prepilin-type N-terminal cleavage/methylation domain-containing protein [Planctomycetota bacterium]|nr:MAG: prepilin-type N-terminal cleavage/methylation domain-containing protein [Planctomycetota bacterium]
MVNAWCSNWRFSSRGFTLVEMLVVISIIVTLSGLLVAGASALRGSQKRTQTNMIMAITSNGMEQVALQRGGAVSGAPHPLHALDEDQRSINAPHLAGLGMASVRVLGVAGRRLTTWVDDGSVQVDRERDEGDVYHGDVWYNAWARSVRSSLGDSMDRLAELGALRAPPLIPVAQAVDRLWLMDSRLRYYPGADGAGTGSSWQPGRVQYDGQWLPYTLPGPAVVDAWGTEILLYQTENGLTGLMSAGPDGSFRRLPGSSNNDAESDNILLFGD